MPFLLAIRAQNPHPSKRSLGGVPAVRATVPICGSIQLSEQLDASNSLQLFLNRAHMNKKEIKSPWLTANFAFWFCGVGCLLLLLFLGHYIWKVF